MIGMIRNWHHRAVLSTRSPSIGAALLSGLAAGCWFSQLPDPRAADVRRILQVDGVKNAYPRWSEDGSRVLFQSNRSGKWQLYVMDSDGSRQVQLTNGDSNNNFPDWSPDNTAIAFVSDRDGNLEIYTMKADGSGVRRVVESSAEDIHPYWSPDGGQILFNSTRDTGKLQIYQINADGTGLKRLVRSDDDDSCTRVSADGRHILYLTNLVAGHDDVMLRNRDGSGAVNLTHDAAPDGWPTWTPDGQRIVFASQRAGEFALYFMNADGSNVRQLTIPPPGFKDVRPSVSRDGRTVVFNREQGETIGIYRVDLPPR